MTFKDFYEMMDYANTMWKGCYTEYEKAEYAHDFCNEYETCKKYGYASFLINSFYSSLMEDYEEGMKNGGVDAQLEYWVDGLSEVAKF